MFFAPSPVAFPPALAEAITRGLFGGPPSARQLNDRAAALRRLWEKLAKRRGQISAGERHYSFLADEAEAYAAYYLPANALKPALILEEALLTGSPGAEAREIRWLDCGTGPGTAYWGVAWWCRQRGRELKFTGWDQSPTFTAIASRLTRGGPLGRADFTAGEKENPLSLLRRTKATHVSFVNSIAEIYPDPAKRQAEITRLLEAMRELERQDGQARYLFLIEPGSQASSRELATLKDALGVPVILPCLDERPCGALTRASDWCHEEVGAEFPSWMNELGAAAGLRKEALLFSYAVWRAGEGVTLPLRGRSRVVSQRLERKGQTECWACTPGGKKNARAQRSKAGEEALPVTEACRGDIWIDEELGPKGDFLNGRRLGKNQDTIFTVLDA
jgi:hypothetical protein